MDQAATNPRANPSAGEAAIEELRTDLACPRCDYNLRGLRGPVVRCPECGHACDIARLLTQRWNRPWWAAPGLPTLQWPTMWAFIGPVILLAGAALGSIPLLMLTAAVYVGVWIWLMIRAAWVFRSRPMRGIAMALLGHVIAVAYLSGLLGVIIAVFAAIAAIAERAIVLGITLFAASFGCAGLLWLARRGDRFMGEQCIRQHLARSG